VLFLGRICAFPDTVGPMIRWVGAGFGVEGLGIEGCRCDTPPSLQFTHPSRTPDPSPNPQTHSKKTPHRAAVSGGHTNGLCRHRQRLCAAGGAQVGGRASEVVGVCASAVRTVHLPGLARLPPKPNGTPTSPTIDWAGLSGPPLGQRQQPPRPSAKPPTPNAPPKGCPLMPC
jgi:hypothetical protein